MAKPCASRAFRVRESVIFVNIMGFRILNWQDLGVPITTMRFVGARMATRLRNLGIRTIGDLLWHLPWRYDKYEQADTPEAFAAGQKISVQGQISSIANRFIFPRRMTVTTAVISSASSDIRAVWFNQPYLKDTLPEGTLVSIAGKVRQDKRGTYLASPVYERLRRLEKLVHTGGLVPVYPETSGVSSKYIRMLIRPLAENVLLPDPLPREIVRQQKFPPLDKALQMVHIPKDDTAAEEGRRRLAFDELLLFQLKALTERRRMTQQRAVSIAFDQKFVQSFVTDLPFTLTKDQKIAAWEILKDLQKPYPMNRLLEGDVGSGKTVVALVAALQVAHSGHQTVILAPTEVLAQQHYATICDLAGSLGISIGLLTASKSDINGSPTPRKKMKERIAVGEVSIIIGTHAVIQKDVRFGALALVVVDEQHRFGIAQRAALVKRSGVIAHLLSMTATPIPRTLALTVFGDLDISLIREKPKHRLSVITRLIQPQQRSETYAFVRQQIKEGRQGFVICPRIETDDGTAGTVMLWQLPMSITRQQIKAVEKEYERLSSDIFYDLRLAMLHGRMKPKEKERIMDKFRSGAIDILVTTSVIEVGVDVPNATFMLIEGAEHFGLAQLHQFRGRVGRADKQSYCFLMPTTDDLLNNERLKTLARVSDGFALAEKDLALRGPGEFFGVKQSGMPDIVMASLTDTKLIQQARISARLILHNDPSLAKAPILRQRLQALGGFRHFE